MSSPNELPLSWQPSRIQQGGTPPPVHCPHSQHLTISPPWPKWCSAVGRDLQTVLPRHLTYISPAAMQPCLTSLQAIQLMLPLQKRCTLTTLVVNSVEMAHCSTGNPNQHPSSQAMTFSARCKILKEAALRHSGGLPHTKPMGNPSLLFDVAA